MSLLAVPYTAARSPEKVSRVSMAGVLLAALLVFVLPAASFGQSRARDWRTARSISAEVYVVDVSYAGSGSPAFRYDFSGPVFGLTLSEPGLLAGVAYGPERTGVVDTVRTRLLDTFLQTTRRFMLGNRDEPGGTRIFVPVGLLVGFRRVSRTVIDSTTISDDLGVTTLAVGGGFGMESAFGKSAVAQVQVMPGVGFASRDIGNSTGLATLVNAGVQLVYGPVVQRFGISVGYDFRYMGWNLSSPFRGTAIPKGAYHYRNLQHGFRIGLAF